MTTYISVNKHTIAANARHGTNDPPIRVATGKNGKPRYGRSVEIKGPARIVYDPQQAILKCGARLVIATEAEVEVSL